MLMHSWSHQDLPQSNSFCQEEELHLTLRTLQGTYCFKVHCHCHCQSLRSKGKIFIFLDLPSWWEFPGHSGNFVRSSPVICACLFKGIPARCPIFCKLSFEPQGSGTLTLGLLMLIVATLHSPEGISLKPLVGFVLYCSMEFTGKSKCFIQYEQTELTILLVLNMQKPKSSDAPVPRLWVLNYLHNIALEQATPDLFSCF